jgi:esterase/lipase superfamily enzyme
MPVKGDLEMKLRLKIYGALALAFLMAATSTASARDCGNVGPHPRRTSIPVFYVTDRNDTGGAGPIHWGRESDVLSHYGRVDTSILRSCATLPADYPAWWEVYAQPLPHHWRDYFLIHADHGYDQMGSMAEAIQTELARLQAGSGRPREIMIYIHGYKNDFTYAAHRAAQFTFDLGFRGVPVIFSWPSQDSFSRYGWDAIRIQRSQPFIRALIGAIVDEIRPDRLHIITHSMGSRATLASLVDLARDHPNLNQQVTSLTLLAPDLDQLVFERLALPELSRVAGRIFLFTNRHDRPLAVSYEFNGGYPLGTYRGTPFVRAGLVTIDTSNVGDTPLRHADFEEEPSIMREIEAGISNVPIGERTCLEEVAAGASVYYLLDPNRAACPASGPYRPGT